jgi:NCAIR mutase (PurE)-related protein
MLDNDGRAIVSRVSDAQLSALKKTFNKYSFNEFAHSGCVVVKRQGSVVTQTGGKVGILTAGTVDLGVAEEAAMIVEEMGCKVYLEADVGVAGLHRLIEPLSKMIQNDVDTLIVVAGRENALPTVVAEL